MAVQDIIRQAANQYGVSPEALIAIAQLESNFNPSARNPSSSAGGLFQFIDSTARGYGLQDRFDPRQASDAAARLARDNANALRNGLGREPTPGELYLAHQQGAGGALRLLRDPNANAASVLGQDHVRLNVPSGTDWRNLTTGDFANLWVNKANQAMGTGPSVIDRVNSTITDGVVSRLPSSASPGTIMQGDDGRNYQFAETTGMAGADGSSGWIPTSMSAGGGISGLIPPVEPNPRTPRDYGLSIPQNPSNAWEGLQSASGNIASALLNFYGRGA